MSVTRLVGQTLEELIEEEQKVLQITRVKPITLWQIQEGDIYKVQHLVIAEASKEVLVCYNRISSLKNHDAMLISWVKPLKEWKVCVEYEDEIVIHPGEETLEDLNEEQRILQTSKVSPGTLWRHYKGDIYKVQRLVVTESSKEILVCYNRITPSNERGMMPIPWVRPLKEWEECIEYENKQYNRFSIIS